MATSRCLPAIHEDILYHVFEHDSLRQTLPDVAVVCHAWTQPAQSALYRDLVFTTMDNRKRDVLLASTMRTHAHLRRHVRRLKLLTFWTHSPSPEMCDWIQLLPAHCMREFHWVWLRGHILPAVVDYPAVRTISHMTLKGRLHSSSKLQPILELPHLRSLSLELSGHEVGELYAPETQQLEQLNVYLSIGYGPIFDKLLAAVGPQLGAFRLVCKMGYKPKEDAQLVSAIAEYLPNLTRLDVSARFIVNEPVPFLDGLVGRYSTLQHLHCAEDTYSERIFKNLPPTLRTLELSSGAVFHEAALLEFLQTRGCSHLTALKVVTSGSREQLVPVEVECRKGGVDFHVVLEHCDPTSD